VTAPEPGIVDTLLEMARLAAMADFDRARPLWEATLIDGLVDGGAALLCKVNHALTDGVGGVQIAMTLYDLTEVGEQPGPTPARPQEAAPRPLGGFRDLLRYEAGLADAALTGALHAASTLILNGFRRPVTAAAAAAATATSIYRTVRPISRPGSPIMRNRKLVRRLGIHEVPKTRLRMAGHVAGGSLNDAFVAAVTGGLRRYHDNHGVTVGDLHMTMPISLRTAADAMGGNRVTLMRFDVPVAETDAAQRIHIIHQRNGKARNERSLPYTQIVAGVLNLMPRWYIGAALRNVDFVASDVPGIPVRCFSGVPACGCSMRSPRRSAPV
jgi:diacylglycerol O-acyltransferase